MKLLPLVTSAALLLAQAAAGNLLTLNPGFEEESRGWKTIDGTYWSISKSQDEENGTGGEFALRRIVFKGTEEGRDFTIWNTQEIGVDPGSKVIASTGVRAMVPENHRFSQFIVLKVFSSDRQELATLEGNPMENRRRYDVYPSEFEIPAGASYVLVGLRVRVEATTSELAYLFFDNVSLTKE